MDGWENAQSFEDATGFILFITSGYVVSFFINVGLMVACIALSLKTSDSIEYILDAIGLLAVAEIDDLVVFYPAFANIAADSANCPLMKMVYHMQVKNRVMESLGTVKTNFLAYAIIGAAMKGFEEF